MVLSLENCTIKLIYVIINLLISSDNLKNK
jgi:hypothetical protein